MALEEEGEDNDLAVLPEWVPCCYDLPHTSHASSDHKLQAGSIEDNVKKLQRRDLSVKESLATRVQIAEQKILQGTVDAIRRCFLRPMLNPKGLLHCSPPPPHPPSFQAQTGGHVVFERCCRLGD